MSIVNLILLLLLLLLIIIIIVFVKKTNKNCQIIYKAIPEDGWVRERKMKKLRSIL